MTNVRSEPLLRVFRQHLFRDTPYVIAVSGGVDSLVLLHLLATLPMKRRPQITAATLDHGLRGQEGADDAAYVESISQAWGVPIVRGYTDVPTIARERGLSIETAAREARYNFLAGVARSLKCTNVITAHHADDQVETVLLHVIRGAGLKGLSGMTVYSPMPGHRDLYLIRPLLEVRKSELEAYAAAHGIMPRVDATNADTTYTRNKIRLEILPALRQINPDVDAALLRLAENARSDDKILERVMRERTERYLRQEAGRVKFQRQIFVTQLYPFQRRVIMAMCERVLLPEESISQERIMAAVHAARHGNTGAVIQMTRRVQMRLEGEYIVVESDLASGFYGPSIDPQALIPLQPSARIPLGDWMLTVNVEVENEDWIVRSRRTGDRFAPPGMDGHTRLLSKWMVDRKIPRVHRERIPLVVRRESDGSETVIAILTDPPVFAHASDVKDKIKVWPVRSG